MTNYGSTSFEPQSDLKNFKTFPFFISLNNPNLKTMAARATRTV